MKRKELQAKILAGVMTVSMAASLCPSVAMAATGSEVAADNTYSGKVTVESDDPLSQNEWGWDNYEATVSFDVVDGKFRNITVTGGAGYTADSRSYLNQAVSLMNTALSGQAASEETLNSYNPDAVSRATCTRKAVKEAMLSLIKEAPTASTTTPVDFSALNEAIQAAEALDGSKYTPESWGEVESKLEAAKSALSAEDQAAVTAAAEALNAAIAALVEAEEGATYVLMNIPYADFYAAEVNNSEPVDAFSSATLNKSRTNTGVMAKGSYHVNADGSDITGITYPVKVKNSDLDKLDSKLIVTDEDSVTIKVTNRGQTSTNTYTGSGALFENESYSYYILNENDTPSYYKELIVDENGKLSFGKAQGTITAVSGVKERFTTDTSYGDYQLDLDGVGIDTNSDTVYGVVISTTDGSGYGLRHLENIWKGIELAWCTGYTTAVHGCPTASDHYKTMMGKTIDKVTYYTSKGILDVDLEDIYVPVKFGGEVQVEKAAVTAGETSITMSELPKEYVPVYSVKDSEGNDLDVKVNGNVLTFANASNGLYTLTVSDKGKVYADLITTFELYTEDIPAVYNADIKAPALVVADGAEAVDFEQYIKNVTTVTVNDKAYAARGRGSIAIINKDEKKGTLGTIDTSVKSGDSPIFEEGARYTIAVASTGYADLTFVYSTVDTSVLDSVIDKAEGLNQSDYKEGWDALRAALAVAKEAQANGTKEDVEKAAADLETAIAGLVKVDVNGGDNNNGENDTNNTTNNTKNNATNNTTNNITNNTTTNKTTKKDKSSGAAKTGDPAGIFGLLGLAAASAGVGGFTLRYKRKRRDEE